MELSSRHSCPVVLNHQKERQHGGIHHTSRWHIPCCAMLVSVDGRPTGEVSTLMSAGYTHSRWWHVGWIWMPGTCSQEICSLIRKQFKYLSFISHVLMYVGRLINNNNNFGSTNNVPLGCLLMNHKVSYISCCFYPPYWQYTTLSHALPPFSHASIHINGKPD